MDNFTYSNLYKFIENEIDKSIRKDMKELYSPWHHTSIDEPQTYFTGCCLIGNINKIDASNNYLTCVKERNEDISMIKKVIFSNPATIIYWNDETKTIVKCQSEDTYDKEKGFLAAFMKKMCGNDNTFNKIINNWCNNPENSNSFDNSNINKNKKSDEKND